MGGIVHAFVGEGKHLFVEQMFGKSLDIEHLFGKTIEHPFATVTNSPSAQNKP
jgi:hypothetical protein